MLDEPMLMWSKPGSHLPELERALDQNAREHSGRALGEPNAFIRDYTSGPITVLCAKGGWWTEYMRVHGKDWKGPVEADEGFLEIVRDLGKPRK